jgi:transcriptional regulator
MHPNPAYRPENTAESCAFAREIGFGMLAVSADGAPLLSHIPFLLADNGATAELHLMRSNPIARACTGPIPARLAVVGPHGYISPDWYGAEDQVPTWNYVAIHFTGQLEPLEDAALPPLLARQSAHFEGRLAPKPEWRMEKVADDPMTRMLRQIRPFRLNIEHIESTWKLNQTKPEAVRLSAADHLCAQGFGQETALLAALMRRPPQQ